MCMCVCACGRAYIYICVLLWMCLFVKLSEFQKSCMVNACVDSGQSRKKRREELTITWKTLEKYHDYPLKKRSGNEKKNNLKHKYTDNCELSSRFLLSDRNRSVKLRIKWEAHKESTVRQKRPTIRKRRRRKQEQQNVNTAQKEKQREREKHTQTSYHNHSTQKQHTLHCCIKAEHHYFVRCFIDTTFVLCRSIPHYIAAPGRSNRIKNEKIFRNAKAINKNCVWCVYVVRALASVLLLFVVSFIHFAKERRKITVRYLIFGGVYVILLLRFLFFNPNKSKK